MLTLIPSAKKREEILKKSYEYAEKHNGKQYHEKPFDSFDYSQIEEIKESILINNLPEIDRTLTPVSKNVRRRGNTIWIDRANEIPKKSKGDSIRGELHLQTYYGKIKVAAKDENGSLKRSESGEILYNQVNGKDEMMAVVRVAVTDSKFNADNIVDDSLRIYVKNQLKSKKPHELIDFQGKPIRRVRCKVKAGRGYMNPDNLTKVKKTSLRVSERIQKLYMGRFRRKLFVWLV